MATKKIEFTTKNAKAFTSWLKRFSLIDNTLLLEVDEPNSILKAKTYNEERSCVKFSKIRFDEAGLTIKPNKDAKLVKVGVFNITRLIKVIEQFNTEFTFTISYDEVTDTNGVSYAGVSLSLKNNDLKISVDCSSLNIFNYIDDNKFMNIIANVDDEIVKFDLGKETIDKINSLCNLDNDYKFMQFVNKENKVFACGKAFEYKINDASSTTESRLNIFKEQFSKIDVENYDVIMGSDRMIFKSTDSNTITVTSMVDDNE
jgi:hypothetical protein